MSTSNEQPFEVAIPDAELELLQKKLDLVRLPDELEEAGTDYGVSLADIKRLVAHWKTGFDWRKTEAEINKLPMFTQDIEVEGHGKLNIHFIHQRSSSPNAIPLLFCHGCEHLCVHTFFVDRNFVPPRAWSLPRSSQASAPLDRRFPRSPELPCCRSQLAGIRLL